MNNIFTIIKNVVKSNAILRRMATPFVDKNLKWKYFSFTNKPFSYDLINGEKVTLYPHGQIARGIFSGWFELDDLIKFQKFIRPGMIVVDIGANIGLYSLIASRLVKDIGKVFSFEPSKSTYLAFQNNMNLNNLQNVQSYNIGLGNIVDQTLSLRLDEGHGDADKYFIPVETKLNEDLANVGVVKELEEQVHLNTLDNILINEQIKSVDFIKIDTEGFEYFILKGAQEILKNSSNVIIFMECTELGTKRAGVDQDMVYQVLKECGLSIFFWDMQDKKWNSDESLAKSEGMIWACRTIDQLSSVIN